MRNLRDSRRDLEGEGAEEEREKVERMRSELEEGVAGQSGAPVGLPLGRVEHLLPDLRLIELAQLPRGDPALRLRVDAHEAVLVVDREQAPAARRERDQLIGLGQRRDERLLAEHVRALLEGLLRVREMESGRRRDDD